MKKDIPLTLPQRVMVEEHLSIVRWVIYHSIKVNETIYGFSLDDLYQEGCLWLCRAAASYNPSSAGFTAYAKVVVRNGLLDYCRRMCRKQKRQSFLEDGSRGELVADGQPVQEPLDDFDARISQLEIQSLLDSVKGDYHGVALLGVEALELKVRGFGVSEIARFYGVKPSHVGAWISRAAEKLRNNRRFLADLEWNELKTADEHRKE